MDTRERVGSIIAWLLLGIYVWTAADMVYAVWDSGRAAAGTPVTIPGARVTIMTTIGGLVSALVISKLAIVDPKTPFSIGGASPDSNRPGFSGMIVRKLAWVYVGAWLLVGLCALIVGVLLYPDVNQSVSDLGTAWLGIAITASYTYFALKAPHTSG